MSYKDNKTGIEFNSFDNNFFPFGKKLGNSAYVNETIDTLNEVEEDNDGKLPTTFNAIEIDWNGATLKNFPQQNVDTEINTTADLINAIKLASNSSPYPAYTFFGRYRGNNIINDSISGDFIVFENENRITTKKCYTGYISIYLKSGANIDHTPVEAVRCVQYDGDGYYAWCLASYVHKSYFIVYTKSIYGLNCANGYTEDADITNCSPVYGYKDDTIIGYVYNVFIDSSEHIPEQNAVPLFSTFVDNNGTRYIYDNNFYENLGFVRSLKDDINYITTH